jgi:hypothetical protein
MSTIYTTSGMYVRRSRFFDLLEFQFLTTEFGLKKNSKTIVEKAFFFVVMSSYVEKSF